MVRMFVPALVPLLLLLPARDAPFHALVADQLGVETRLPKDGRRRFARVVPAHDLDLKAIGIPDMGWAHAFDRWQAGQIRTLLCCEFAINHFLHPLNRLNSSIQHHIGLFPLTPSLKPSNERPIPFNEKRGPTFKQNSPAIFHG